MSSAQHEFQAFLDDFEKNREKGEKLERADVLRMLELDPESPECDLLRSRARQKARRAANNMGRVWSAVGIEHRPCAMNCQFCSFGESWGLVREEYDWTDEDITEAARQSVKQGASWFTMRTNEIYSVGRLCELARKTRASVPGNYALVVNTGELTKDEGTRLKAAGIDGVYHTWRLGEGTTTQFTPETRLSTMRSIVNAGLRLYHMVEPLGPEHGNAEIAERILAADECGASLGGVMARINVPGTPLANSGQVEKKRLSQIVAACRLCAGPETRDICVVPPLRECLDAGANVVTVEVGSVPRSEETNQKSAWRGFDVRDAMELLGGAGYETGAKNA